MFVCAATAQPLTLHSYHPHPSDFQEAREFESNLKSEVLPYLELLHPMVTGGCFLFPERRLIQYDCGKFFWYYHVLFDVQEVF